MATTLQDIEFGDFGDNLTALSILLRFLADGNVVEGAKRLQQLKEHILSLRGSDPKSATWLLPAIDLALEKA